MFSKQFENGFNVHYYKIKTSKNLEKIEFYDSPDEDQSNFLADSSQFNPVFYYSYGTAKKGKDEFTLLGVSDYFAQASMGAERILGWVKVVNDGDKQMAVLWNSSIGLRPEKNAQLDRKSLVFEKSRGGFKALEDYLNYKTVNDSFAIVDQNAVANYHAKHEEKNGRVHRWLPMYDSVEDPDDYMMSAGVTTDINDLLLDMESMYTSDEFDIILILDGSGSMTHVWQNLPQIIFSIM